MLPFSENNQNIKIATGQYSITICHSKQLQEGLMVFSNDSLHFLKIKIFFFEFTKNYLVALIWLDLQELDHANKLSNIHTYNLYSNRILKNMPNVFFRIIFHLDGLLLEFR